MTTTDDIRELKEKVEKLEDFQNTIETDNKVKAIVKVRCAVAWSSVLFFISLLGAVLSFYSDVVKEASKAALKVIMEHLR